MGEAIKKKNVTITVKTGKYNKGSNLTHEICLEFSHFLLVASHPVAVHSSKRFYFNMIQRSNDHKSSKGTSRSYCLLVHTAFYLYFTVDETEAQRSKVIFSRLYNRLVEEPELETSSDPVVLSSTIFTTG